MLRDVLGFRAAEAASVLDTTEGIGDGGEAHAVGLLVITLADGQIAALTRFDNAVLPRFGLPRSLPDTGRPPQS